MADQLRDRFLSPDGGSGWFAYRPAGDEEEDDEPWEPPAEFSVIRLMGDHTVVVPLWSEDGLMFSEPEELVDAFGVSAELARDLAEWASAWHTRAGRPEHDAEAARLVRRLGSELDHRYTVVYKP